MPSQSRTVSSLLVIRIHLKIEEPFSARPREKEYEITQTAVAVDFFRNIGYIKSILLWQAAFAEGEPPLL